jgi:hypothetical protein
MSSQAADFFSISATDFSRYRVQVTTAPFEAPTFSGFEKGEPT